MKSSLSIIIVLILGLKVALGQEVYSLTDCVNEALENAYNLQQQTFDNQLNSLKLKSNKSKYLPQINAYATYFNYPWDVPFYFFPSAESNILSGGLAAGPYPVPIGLQHNYSLGISLEQTLLDADFFITKNGQKSLHHSNELLLAKEEEVTIYEVTKMFFEILKNSEKERLIELSQKRIEKFIRIVEIRVENEMTYATDLDEIKIKQKQLEAKNAVLLVGLQKQKKYLNFLMGRDINTEIDLKKDTISFALNNFDSNAVKSDINSQLIEQDIAINKLRIKAIQNQKLPELKAFVNLMANSQSNAFSPFSDQQYWYNPSTIGLSLQIPIMNGLANNHQIAQQEIEGNKKELMKEQNDQYVKMSLENAKADLEIKRLVLEEKKLNLELQQRINDRKADRFENELIGIGELMESNGEMDKAESEFTDATYDLLLAQLEILKTSGMLRSILQN